MGGFDLSDYNTVPERIADFKALYPEGSLRPADPLKPYSVEVIGDQTFIVVVAAAYRNPTDPAPGIGMAWKCFPGDTPYTKKSELQNAETSAWGRAIIAALASESKSVASREDVEHADQERIETAARNERPLCAKCNQPLTGNAQIVDGKRVHKPECPPADEAPF